MPDIKIKRCADKENLKKLVRYIKATFANKSEVNEEFYTKEQIDTMLGSGSGGTGGGGTGGDYYTKSEIDTKLNSKANTSDLSTVATSGDYNDLINKPNITAPSGAATDTAKNAENSVLFNGLNTEDFVRTTGNVNQTITGTKTFNATINGNLSGTATYAARSANNGGFYINNYLITVD